MKDSYYTVAPYAIRSEKPNHSLWGSMYVMTNNRNETSMNGYVHRTRYTTWHVCETLDKDTLYNKKESATHVVYAADPTKGGKMIGVGVLEMFVTPNSDSYNGVFRMLVDATECLFNVFEWVSAKEGLRYYKMAPVMTEAMSAEYAEKREVKMRVINAF